MLTVNFFIYNLDLLLKENDSLMENKRMNNKLNIRYKLKSSGLKATIQRVKVLETLCSLKSHPTAETIIKLVREDDPNIGIGTVYKILDTLVNKCLIKKVKTENGVVRYDGTVLPHHHLYSPENEKIGDYYNEELDKMLKNFFERNKIKDFSIDSVTVNINGSFIQDKI